MTKKQKQRFLSLCKEFKVKPVISRYYEICHKILLSKIHSTAKKEKLHDGHYWLIDHWILEYNRKHGSEQSACVEDLKVGMAESDQDPIDFIYDRLLEIKEYRKKGWIDKDNDEYDDDEYDDDE